MIKEKICKIRLLALLMAVAMISCGSDNPDEEPPGGTPPPPPSDYAPAVIKEAKYDRNLNELYIFWDNTDTSWDSGKYAGTEFRFGTLLSGGSTVVTRRMIPDQETFPAMKIFRSVVVTPNVSKEDVSYRTIYNIDGEEQYSDWTSITANGTKVVNYSAVDEFIEKVPSQISLHFLFENEDSYDYTTNKKYLDDMLGQTDEAKLATVRNWYYSVVSSMSFDPYNLAFDPYTQFWMHFGDGGLANALDYPNHATGRAVRYNRSYPDLWSYSNMDGFKYVTYHEMGHCVEWMPNRGKYRTDSKDFDRMGYQEGYPDGLKIALNGYKMAEQMSEYRSALEKPYESSNPASDGYRYVWQIEYNISGAFMSWLRSYDGDILRKLPWTTQMDLLKDSFSLEDAVKLILQKSYPNIDIKELWREYRREILTNPDFRSAYPDYSDTNTQV